MRIRSRMRKFRDVSTQDGETVDPGNERGEMGNSESSKGHGNLPGSHGSHGREKRVPVPGVHGE